MAKLSFRLHTVAFALMCAIPLLLSATRAGADVAFCIIGVFFLLHSTVSKDWLWTRHPEMRTLGVLWGFMLAVSWITPFNHAESFISALIWGRFIVFFAAARYWLLNRAGALRTVSYTGLFVLLLVAIDTFWQYRTGVSLSGRPMNGDRLTGPLGYANIGNLLLKTGFPMLGVAFYQLMSQHKTRLLWLPIAGLCTIISLVMVSGERSTAVLLFLSLGIIGLMLFIAMPQARKWVLSAVVGITLMLGALAATQPVIQSKAAFFVEQVSNFWVTPYGQLYIGAGNLWMQHPFTGIGIKQFFKACDNGALNTNYCDIHPHNMYAEWMALTGTPGICLLLLSLFFMSRELVRKADFTGANAIVTAFAFAGCAVVVFPFVVTQSPFANWPAMLYWYCLSLSLGLTKLIGSARDTDGEGRVTYH